MNPLVEMGRRCYLRRLSRRRENAYLNVLSSPVAMCSVCLITPLSREPGGRKDEILDAQSASSRLRNSSARTLLLLRVFDRGGSAGCCDDEVAATKVEVATGGVPGCLRPNPKGPSFEVTWRFAGVRLTNRAKICSSVLTTASSNASVCCRHELKHPCSHVAVRPT